MRTLVALVTGGRRYAGRSIVFTTLDQVNPTVVIHGACGLRPDGRGRISGADRWASEWCKARGVTEIQCPADWARHGKAAGPMRNTAMLRAYNVEVVLAFPGDGGTQDMIRKARRSEITVLLSIPNRGPIAGGQQRQLFESTPGHQAREGDH